MRYREPEPGSQALTLDSLSSTTIVAGLPLGLRSPWSTRIAFPICERVLAAALLIALAPVLLAAGLVIWLLSRRPPLVAHARVGQGGRPLWVVKFRSMWGDRTSGVRWQSGFIERLKVEPVPELKKPNDPRITSRFAAFCRKYSIDELPQLWHVAEGRMSLVGPRPMTADELCQHYGRHTGEVLRAKPGLTGLWQIRGRSSLSYRERRRLDLFLVRKASVRLYLAILVDTFPRVLTGKDAW